MLEMVPPPFRCGREIVDRTAIRVPDRMIKRMELTKIEFHGGARQVAIPARLTDELTRTGSSTQVQQTTCARKRWKIHSPLQSGDWRQQWQSMTVMESFTRSLNRKKFHAKSLHISRSSCRLDVKDETFDPNPKHFRCPTRSWTRWPQKKRPGIISGTSRRTPAIPGPTGLRPS